ncbi:FliH/SctL family protein [Reinekea thalattae]|uniref:Flagellar assembly protein FliH n=1 Tax=Reinekea thalattae TaxID=2593301 RepID=A0A5C8Z7W6_9GAMM|nr:FliH/SctL family protein [Reinekea thalattae]TXR53404.1 hypothetical protein FME95_02205 [Reinekea thalattae]
MSSTSNLTSRKSLGKNASTKAESVALPRWDRHGNLISSPKRPEAEVTVENVEEQVKLPTVAELEKITEQAYNEGFEQGYEQGMAQGQKKGLEQGYAEGFTKGETEGQTQGFDKGYEEALQKGELESQKKVDLFHSVADAMSQQLIQEETELKEAVLALSLRIAKQVLLEELAVNQEHIKRIVHAAVQALPNPDEKLVIYTNSADAELVRSIAEENWRVAENDNVASGGCQVKSDTSYVDYSIDRRFDTAVAQLMTLPSQPLSEQHKAPISEQPLADVLENTAAAQAELTDPQQPLVDTTEESTADSLSSDSSLNPEQESTLEQPSTASLNAQAEQEITDDVTEQQSAKNELAGDESAEHELAEDGSTEDYSASNEQADEEFVASEITVDTRDSQLNDSLESSINQEAESTTQEPISESSQEPIDQEPSVQEPSTQEPIDQVKHDQPD